MKRRRAEFGITTRHNASLPRAEGNAAASGKTKLFARSFATEPSCLRTAIFEAREPEPCSPAKPLQRGPSVFLIEGIETGWASHFTMPTKVHQPPIAARFSEATADLYLF
jgi:hypothetical protein